MRTGPPRGSRPSSVGCPVASVWLSRGSRQARPDGITVAEPPRTHTGFLFHGTCGGDPTVVPVPPEDQPALDRSCSPTASPASSCWPSSATPGRRRRPAGPRGAWQLRRRRPQPGPPPAAARARDRPRRVHRRPRRGGSDQRQAARRTRGAPGRHSDHVRRRSRRGLGRVDRQTAAAFRAAGWPGSRRLVHLAVAAFPVRRPQLELLQLAGRGAGQLGGELDRRRCLEARQPLLAPGISSASMLRPPSCQERARRAP